MGIRGCRRTNGVIEVRSSPAFPEPIPQQHADASSQAYAHGGIARRVRYGHPDADSGGRAQNNREGGGAPRVLLVRLPLHIMSFDE